MVDQRVDSLMLHAELSYLTDDLSVSGYIICDHPLDHFSDLIGGLRYTVTRI
jgi:hypothetical protein